MQQPERRYTRRDQSGINTAPDTVAAGRRDAIYGLWHTPFLVVGKEFIDTIRPCSFRCSKSMFFFHT